MDQLTLSRRSGCPKVDRGPWSSCSEGSFVRGFKQASIRSSRQLIHVMQIVPLLDVDLDCNRLTEPVTVLQYYFWQWDKDGRE